MRFHVLGLPHTVTNHDFVACAYTQKVLKFAKMMRARGHHIIHYGHEDSNLEANEHVTVITNEDFKIAYGNYDWRKNFFKFDMKDHAYQTFYKNAIREIQKRKKTHDFILPFWGTGVRPICDAHKDLICVEPGIGYAGGHWARFKVFESYAIYHAYYGLDAVGTCKQNFYEVVIPNYFDPEDFEYCEDKDDYFLFMGRVYEGKGIHIAIETTKLIGAKLIVAGQNSLKSCGYDPVPPHVTEFGYAGIEDRKKLMSKAKGAFVASLYVEPFGGVQMEMLMSGTPTITTDWGAFSENNIHGVTGYRCRTMEQFCWAANNIHKIKPEDCRRWAMNFSLNKIGKMYEEYFQSVMKIFNGKGYYEPNPQRRELNWLEKEHPRTPKTKIAIWGTDKWSIGRINDALTRYLSKWFQVDFYNWHVVEDSKELFTNGKWKEYHKIIGTTALVFSCLNIKFLEEIPPELQTKMIAVSHCPVFKYDKFREEILDFPKVTYGGVSKQITEIIKNKTGKGAAFLPTGVDIKHFEPNRKIQKIKTIGFSGNPTQGGKEWCDVKRPDVLKLIALKAGTGLSFIHGKHYTEHVKIYDSIDMFVCCSAFEGSCQGIIECAAANIPVISTKVGYANMLKNIITFETVNEAADIIKRFNENPNELTDYIQALGEEVRNEWNWEHIAHKFWKPVIDYKS